MIGTPLVRAVFFILEFLGDIWYNTLKILKKEMNL